MQTVALLLALSLVLWINIFIVLGKLKDSYSAYYMKARMMKFQAVAVVVFFIIALLELVALSILLNP